MPCSMRCSPTAVHVGQFGFEPSQMPTRMVAPPISNAVSKVIGKDFFAIKSFSCLAALGLVYLHSGKDNRLSVGIPSATVWTYFVP